MTRAPSPAPSLTSAKRQFKAARLFLAILACLSLSVPAFGLTSTELEAAIRAATTGAGSPDFTITPPAAGSGVTVDAAAFGVDTNHDGASNYTAFANAISYCKAQGVYKLTVPKGTYKIGSYDGTNSPANLSFSGFHDFIFDAQGAEFLFQSKCCFLQVTGCQRVVFANLTMDWNWALEPVQSLAQIKSIDTGGNYIDLKFPFENNPNPAAGVYELVEVDGTNYNCSHQGMGVVGAWQLDFSRTAQIATNVLRYYAKAGAVGNNWFNINGAKVGQYCVLRHYSYEANGVYVNNSTQVTFTNNTVYSTLGMGYLSVNNQYYQIVDSKIIRRPGSLYRFSSASDAIHVANSFGYFKIQNVEIGNAGDDAINIHDTLSQGVAVTGPNTLTALNVIAWRNPFDPGDPVELRQKDFAPSGFSSVVTARSYNDSAAQCTLTFADPLPVNLDTNTILFNRHYNSGHYIVRNCNIHDNKGRGLITHCASGTLEDNQFLRNYNPALFVVCLATTYSEGFNPTNIIIRNNVFDGNDLFRKQYLSMPNNVVIAGETAPSGIVSYPICQNIIFENNLVKNCPYAGLEVASAADILIKNNRFENPYQFSDLWAAVPGSVLFLKCSNVVANGNGQVIDPGFKNFSRGISVNSATATNNIFVDGFVAIPTAPGGLSGIIDIVATGGVLQLQISTNALTGAPTLQTTTNLSSPWTPLAPDAFTSSYPAMSNGAYSVSLPLPASGSAFFRISTAP